VRMERGLITAALEGPQSRSAVRDFERLLQVGGADLDDDERVAIMVGLLAYYISRADLGRMVEVLEFHAGLEQGPPWVHSVIDALFGLVAVYRGEFATAASRLEPAIASLAAVGPQENNAAWLRPLDPIATTRLHLALVGFVRGDLIGAEAEVAQVERRAAELGFPQGPFSLAFARFLEIWMRIATGQLDRASVVAADLIDQAERHGFDLWQLWGGVQQATVSAMAALGAEELDPTALSTHIATMTTFVDILRTVELNLYITVFDGVLARLLIAAGQPEQARARLDTALQLARDTGMHFYDAELLRVRAHTHVDTDARCADLGAALDLAHRQGATLFELLAALDDFKLRGEPARAALADAVSRFPANGALPELALARNAVESFDLGSY
jgi:tetratricopeptide (TPR) repeat protein